MSDGVIIPLGEIAKERAALQPQIAAFDKTIGEASAKLADYHRERLGRQDGKENPKADKVRHQHLEASHKRAALVQRLIQLDHAELQMRGEIDRLEAQIATLERDAAALAELPAGLLDLCYQAADVCARRPDGVSQARAGIFRQAANICYQGDEVRARLARLRERLAAYGGSPDAAQRLAA